MILLSADADALTNVKNPQVLDSASQGLLASSLDDPRGGKGGGGTGPRGPGSSPYDKARGGEPFFKHRCRYCGKVGCPHFILPPLPFNVNANVTTTPTTFRSSGATRPFKSTSVLTQGSVHLNATYVVLVSRQKAT